MDIQKNSNDSTERQLIINYFNKKFNTNPYKIIRIEELVKIGSLLVDAVELTIFNNKIMYFPLEFIMQSSSKVTSSIQPTITIYDEIDVEKLERFSANPFYDGLAIIDKYVNNVFQLNNCPFSHITISVGTAYVQFVGYKITLL